MWREKMELDYTPNEKRLLYYIRQGYKPKSCDPPEEALRWRKERYASYRNSIISEEKAIEKIRALERTADKEAGNEVRRASGMNPADFGKKSSNVIKYIILAWIFFGLSVATGGIGTIIGFMCLVIASKLKSKYYAEKDDD